MTTISRPPGHARPGQRVRAERFGELPAQQERGADRRVGAGGGEAGGHQRFQGPGAQREQASEQHLACPSPGQPGGGQLAVVCGMPAWLALPAPGPAICRVVASR